jgi:hypothetical protein
MDCLNKYFNNPKIKKKMSKAEEKKEIFRISWKNICNKLSGPNRKKVIYCTLLIYC